MKCSDLTGLQFGHLVANTRGPNTVKSEAQWYCTCDCGSTAVLVRAASLVSGNTKSCDCSRRQSKYRTSPTPRGFDIEPGATPESITAWQVFLGCMLGDGHVDKVGRFIEPHAVAQKGLCDFLHTVFLAAGWHPMVCPWRKAQPPRQAQVAVVLPCCEFMLGQTTQWYEEAERGETERRKTIPDWFSAEHLTAPTLAAWFAGDGSGRQASSRMRGQLVLATNNFQLAEVERLAELLHQAHGIRAQPQKARRTRRGRMMYTLSTTSAVESIKLFNLIDSLLPSCVQYKLDGVRSCI